MPYVLISTQTRLESGPTIVGDQWSDPNLMDKLGAKLMKEFGNNFEEYRCDEPPRVVLNKLEKLGYHVISMTGVGQTCIWTLLKKSDEEEWSRKSS
ncbi:GTP cyclohydrolase 1 feedback regulatory protein-like [Babylonia areolata]|uniref:GTP cyclohydrolase 1 feedback regulatory protein-like n=1 Tax=Babylonia areolata TaxID=304850 RepID=UPI003FD4B440